MRTLFLTFAILLTIKSAAQFNYTFSVKHEAYQLLVNATSIDNNTLWDEEIYKLPIGFPFWLDGNKLDSFVLAGPGFLFNDTIGALYGFCAFNGDLYDRGTNTTGIPESPIRYSVAGNAGNRVCKIEIANAGFWDEWRVNNTADDYINFQIWLYEGSNAVELRYGTSQMTYPEDALIVCSQPLVSFLQLNHALDSVQYAYYLVGDPQNPTLDSAFNVQMLESALDDIPVAGTVYRFEPVKLNIEEQQAMHDIKVYPTVTTESITIDNHATGNVSYIVCTIDGRQTTLKGMMPGGRQTLTISALPAGMYIICIENKSVRRYVKFIKQ